MNDWALWFLAALAVTLAVEAAVAGLAAPRGRRAVVSLYSVCLNLVSLPLAWLSLAWLSTTGPSTTGPSFGWTDADVWLAELVVTVLEAVGYRLLAGISTGRAIAISALANAAPVLLVLLLARAL